MPERRRYMRFRAELDADYWASGASSGTAGRARVQDISREGMRVALAAPLPAGEQVEFTLQVPGDNIPIFATGEVTWAAEEGPAAGAGIRFRRIKPLDLARVLDYLYALWLRA